MSQRIKKVIIVFSLLFACFAAVHFAFAQSANELVFGGQEGAIGNAIGLGSEDPRIIAAKIIRVFLGFLGIIALGLIIYAGYLWMTAAGNEENIEKAKKILANAVIGLVIILASFAIASYIINKLLEATGGGGGGCDPECESGYHCCSGNQCVPDGTLCSVIPPVTSSFYPTSTSPADGSQDVILNYKVRFYFNTAVDGSSVSNTTFKVTDINGIEINGVPATNGRIITFTPSGICPPDSCIANGCFPKNEDINIQISNILSVSGLVLECSLSTLCDITFKTGETVDCEDPTVNLDFNQVCLVPNNELFANSADDSGVVQVEFFVDGVSIPDIPSGNNPVANIDNHNPFNTRGENLPSIWDGTGYTVGDLINFKVTAEDMDYHTNSNSKNLILRPEHCCNGVKDGDEEGIDCGGSCAGCEGAACGVSLSANPSCLANPDDNCDNNNCSSGFCNCGSYPPGPLPNDSCEEKGYDPAVGDTCCICESSPIIDWVTPMGGFCDGYINMPCQNDDDCTGSDTCDTITPNGTAGNLVTIGGRFFGTYGPGSKVEFSDDNGSTWKIADLADCGNNWKNNQIIIEVPDNLLSGDGKIIKVTADNDFSDTTGADGRGAPLDFVVNTIERPGLCELTPDNEQMNKPITYEGIRLNNNIIARFGKTTSFIAALNNNPGTTLTQHKADVPNLETGETTTFVVDGNISSNFLNFIKNAETPTGPAIASFDPFQGAPGQYVTIHGSGFGDTKGTSEVFFGPVVTGTKANYSFPTICAASVWSDDQVIVKVPDGLANNDYIISMEIGASKINTSELEPNSTFEVDSDLPLAPSLCKLDPILGPNGSDISLYGEYFGVFDSNSKVRFQLDHDQSGSAITSWGPSGNADKIITTVHNEAVTGPVKAIKDLPEKVGNGLNFTVGNCTKSEDCGSLGFCCPVGSYKASMCASDDPAQGGDDDGSPDIDDCYVSINSSVYEWDFSTGIPENVITCGGYTSAEACAASGACPNSPGQCSTKTEITMGECGAVYCDTTYPQWCPGGTGCDYILAINKCSTQETCDQTSTTILSGYTAECHEVGGKHVWQINESASCPADSFRDTNNWCTVGTVSNPTECTACASGLSCYNGECIINQTICPSGSTCDLTENKCLSNDICECCCRVTESAQDCCAGLTCEAGGCGSDPVNYGLCTGCRVEVDGDITTVTADEQNASDNACNCSGGASRYCVIDGTYPNGVCRDKEECDSTPATSTCNADPNLCSSEKYCDTDSCLCEIAELCDKIPSTSTCDPEDNLCDLGFVCDDATCRCQPKRCNDDLTQCSNPINCDPINEYCDQNCYCQPNGGGPGEICESTIIAACEEGVENCLADYACLNDGDCRCCCEPLVCSDINGSCVGLSEGNTCGTGTCEVSTNAAGLRCSADKTPCDCVDPADCDRGLYCGCSTDDQCGNLDLIGCSFDTCCRERPEITSMSPLDGDEDVCRNTAISATFDQYMDISGLSGNVVVIGEYGTESCPAGTQYILSSESKGKGFFGRVFARVSNAFKEMANVIFHRARAMAGNFCAIAGTVSGVHNADETSTLTFYPSALLDSNKKYYVIIKGDGDLTDANKAGVKSYYDIAMADDWTDLDGVNGVNDNDRTFNGVKFYGKVWSFTTRDDSNNNGICEIDHVEIDPASYLFQTTSDDLNEDDTNASADSFDTVADRDKLFTARALSSDGLELSSITGVYAWGWSWDPPPSSNVANFSTTVTGLLVNSKLVEAKEGVTDAQTDVTAKATITAGGSGEFSAVAPIWVFVCANPWPAVVGGLWAPWGDRLICTDQSSIFGLCPIESPIGASCEGGSGWCEKNCTVTGGTLGECYNTNYDIYYCRDAGGVGTADDLPAVISDETIIRGSSTIQNFLKEFYFFREEAPVLSGIAPSGMLSYWRFDDGSGTIASDSVGGRNGTLVASGATWETTGYSGKALNFDGEDDDYILISDTGFPKENEARTIEAWFKVAATTNHRQPIFFYGTTNPLGGDATYILMWETGTMCIGRWGGVPPDKCTTETYNDNYWHHAAFTFDGVNTKLYIDGVEKIYEPRTYDTTLTGSGFISGSDGPGGQSDNFIGLIDEVAIYDRALSAAEVLDHFQSGSYFSNLILTDQTTGSDGRVYADWDEITGSGITGYKIYYGTKSNDYDDYKTVTGGANTSYLVTGLTVGKTYYFNITATYPNGVESAYLGEKSVEVKDEGAPEVAASYWKFNEGSGAIISDSAGGNNGTIINGASWELSGKSGKALSFDGTDDYVSISDTGFPAGNSARTMEAWIKTSAQETQIILYYGTPAHLKDAFIFVGESGEIRIGNYGGSPTEKHGAKKVNDGQWHHIAMTYDGNGGLKLYIDSVLDTLHDNDGTSENYTNRIFSTILTGNAVISYNDPAWAFNGLIDEVAIYNYALSEAEIKGHYSSGNYSGNLVLNNLEVTKSCEGEIDIKWDDNSAADVAGYKVHYGAVSGQYGGVEDAGDVLEAALTGLTTGNTYYIAVSAYDSSGNESVKKEINSGQGILVSNSCSVPNGAVSYWKFDEGSGTTVSDSVGGNIGTITDGATWVTGKSGKALSFDGENDYVNIAKPMPQDLRPTNAVTLEAWVNPPSHTNSYSGSDNLGGIIASQYDPDYSGYSILIEYRGFSNGGVNGGVHFQVGDGNSWWTNELLGQGTTNVALPTDDQWTHVVAVAEVDKTYKVYFNGELVANWKPGSAIAYTDNSRLAIGWNNHTIDPADVIRFFNGKIDEAIIYNRALSPAEVKLRYYNSGGE